MTSAGLATSAAALAPLVPGLGAAAVRALVVDDADFDRRRLIRACGQAGLNMVFREAATLQGMRTALGSGIHDLVFIDYRLPDGDGLSALEMLRDDPLNGDAAAVMIAGETDAAVAVAALKAGACDYLGKSAMNPSTLAEAVAAAIGGPGDGPGGVASSIRARHDRLVRLAQAAAGPAGQDLDRLIAASAWAVDERETGQRLRRFLAEVAKLGRAPMS